MRHAAASFAFEVNALQDRDWDIVFATDMCNLSEFKGLVRKDVAELPSVIYFHENQFSYPSRGDADSIQRDLHFAMTNLVSVLSADAVWFNSDFHRQTLFSEIDSFLKSAPRLAPADDARWQQSLNSCQVASEVHSPGIDPIALQTANEGPIRILWAARWEHDKNPQQFFEAIDLLKAVGVEFRLSVVGESFREVPQCFEEAAKRFSDHIDHWGYAKSAEEYRGILASADLIVSTAIHEFFGIAVVEAMSAGCLPVFPDRLSYPELVNRDTTYLYDGTTQALADTIKAWSELQTSDPGQFRSRQAEASELASRFAWHIRAEEMDDRLEQIVDG